MDIFNVTLLWRKDKDSTIINFQMRAFIIEALNADEALGQGMRLSKEESVLKDTSLFLYASVKVTDTIKEIISNNPGMMDANNTPQ